MQLDYTHFSKRDIEDIGKILTTSTDEELFEEFGDIFIIIRDRIRNRRIKKEREKGWNYSNKNVMEV